MRQPVITLTTDFGLADHYVGTMKGVILGICPRARIVDISHDAAAFEIPDGGYLIAQAYRHFPRGTVHVVVVDPGVGTSRRPILAEAAGYYFVAPDNGVLSMIWSRHECKVRWITAERYFRKPVSQTFHGRDVFAPVAAHLAGGVLPARFGKRIEDYMRSDFEAPVRTGKRTWSGRILRIDRFGNIVTNFRLADFPGLDLRPFAIVIGPQTISTLARNYGESTPGELFALEGSSGYLEISMNQASAARAIGCQTGAPAELILY